MKWNKIVDNDISYDNNSNNNDDDDGEKKKKKTFSFTLFLISIFLIHWRVRQRHHKQSK